MRGRLEVGESVSDAKLTMEDGSCLFDLVPVSHATVTLTPNDGWSVAHVCEMRLELHGGVDAIVDVDLEPIAAMLRHAGYTVTKE